MKENEADGDGDGEVDGVGEKFVNSDKNDGDNDESMTQPRHGGEQFTNTRGLEYFVTAACKRSCRRRLRTCAAAAASRWQATSAAGLDAVLAEAAIYTDGGRVSEMFPAVNAVLFEEARHAARV